MPMPSFEDIYGQYVNKELLQELEMVQSKPFKEMVLHVANCQKALADCEVCSHVLFRSGDIPKPDPWKPPWKDDSQETKTP